MATKTIQFIFCETNCTETDCSQLWPNVLEIKVTLVLNSNIVSKGHSISIAFHSLHNCNYTQFYTKLIRNGRIWTFTMIVRQERYGQTCFSKCTTVWQTIKQVPTLQSLCSAHDSCFNIHLVVVHGSSCCVVMQLYLPILSQQQK